ncbi:MAG: dual specificity protein phosphatase family protein [Planctomycetales bacterium]|nr:dual specificity protein phosphatase family protein [Planctomycetales bacterium]
MQRLRAQVLFVPTLGWNVLLGRMLKVRRWWDRIDDHVVIGAMPFPSDVARLHKEGVRGVVNTCEEYSGPSRLYHNLGMRQLRVQTVDFTHPSIEAVQQAVDFIAEHSERGESVYVHCKAGRARSATIVLCWLIQQHGLTPEQGQQLLLERRPHINRRLVERPVVREFYQRHRGELITDPAEAAEIMRKS